MKHGALVCSSRPCSWTSSSNRCPRRKQNGRLGLVAEVDCRIKDCALWLGESTCPQANNRTSIPWCSGWTLMNNGLTIILVYNDSSLTVNRKNASQVAHSSIELERFTEKHNLQEPSRMLPWMLVYFSATPVCFLGAISQVFFKTWVGGHWCLYWSTSLCLVWLVVLQ